jgi:hypothetical protein
LKEKYFLGGSFLQEPLGNNPSYAWQSILQARRVLERGLIWGVGDGESIWVWGDRWLRGTTSLKVQTSILERDPDIKVCDLIDCVLGWWKVGMIGDLFLSADSEAICNLALSPLRNPDKPIWLGTSNGCFSIHSANHQEMALREQGQGESSNAGVATEVWNHIWKILALGVVRNFMWKLCSDILPTKDHLFRRHVVQDPVCPMCSGDIETTWHMVWACPASVAVWQECHSEFRAFASGGGWTGLVYSDKEAAYNGGTD